MVLGLLLLGMLIGASAAAAWVFAGGSLLLALVLYGLVGTMVVLGTAVLSFLLSERKTAAAAERLHAAE
jgi:hypothetical protein